MGTMPLRMSTHRRSGPHLGPSLALDNATFILFASAMNLMCNLPLGMTASTIAKLASVPCDPSMVETLIPSPKQSHSQHLVSLT